MHIAHVTSFYSVPALSPSSAVQMRGIAYRAAGHEFSVIVPGTVASVRWTEYGTVVTVPARGPMLRRGFVRIPFAIRRALDRLVPDRLEVADRLSFRQLGVWASENRVPAILFTDDFPANVATDRTLANYNRVICGIHQSTFSPTESAAHNVVMMKPGVDLEVFTPLRHNPALRDTSGADLIVVCAAPLTATGSVSLAIEVIRDLTNRGIDAQLMIVGDGPLRSRLARSAHGLSVHFLSAQELSLFERSEVFATADFALVTVGGAAGHAVALEALSSGTPVILIGANQYRIELCHGGGTTAHADPSHIIHAITTLGEETVENRRRAARKSALQFDGMPLAQAMVELHESLE